MIDLKTKGGTLLKTTKGVVPVSPEQNGLFPVNANYRLFIYNVLVPDVNQKTGNVTWFFKHGEHIDHNEKGVIQYIKNKYFAGIKSLFQMEKILLIIDMTDHAMSINSQYDPTLVDENRKGSYDKELHNGLIDLGFVKRKKNIHGDKSFELFTFPQIWSIEEVKAKLDSYHKGLLENKDVSTPTTIYNARPFTNDFDNKIANVNKCLLGGCPGSGKEAASLALTIRISDKKEYTNNLINLFTATIPDTLCEPLNELANLKGMNVDEEFVDFSRIKLYIVESWFNSNKKDLSGKTQAYLRNNHTFVESADDIPVIHSKTEVPILIAGYHDIAYRGNETTRPKYASLEGRIGTLLIGEGHKCLKPGNKMWKVFTTLGWKFLMPVTGTPYDLIFGNDDVLYFPPEERSIMTRQQMILDKLNNHSSDFKHMPIINYYGITEIYNEVIEEMRQNTRWKDDAEGMTMQKLHTAYDKNTKTFKYFEFLHRMYSRLLASDGFGDHDGLAIKNAPGLCEAAKNNLLFILPVGMLGVTVKDYIPQLVRQLKDSGALGVYHPYVSYDEDMLDVKQAVEDPNKKTITFTAIKNTTGTNIKGWGSTVLMRPVGDSLTFLEQGPEGRIGRASDGKTNSGLFLMEPYNAINLKVQIEESLSIERGENKSHSEIVNETLACHFFYNGTNGKFAQLDKPDFMAKLEELSAKGNYGLELCVRRTDAPASFDIEFKNNTAKESENVELNNEGNKNAQNKRQKALKQLALDFDNDKNKDKSWHNMKKIHIAKLKKIAFQEGFTTIKECGEYVNKMLFENYNQIKKEIGRGVEYIPTYINDPDQVNIVFTNRWIDKMNNTSTPELMLEQFNDLEQVDIDTAFMPEDLQVLEIEVRKALQKLKDLKITKPTVLDPCGGRMSMIYLVFKIGPEYGIDIDPKRCYYNDIDPSWFNWAKKFNEVFSLGIPEKNFLNKDAKDINFMKFNLVTTNLPLQNVTVSNKEKENRQPIWQPLCEHFVNNLLEPNGQGVYHGIQSRNGHSNSSTNKINDIIKNNKILQLESNVNDYFKKQKITGDFISLTVQSTKNDSDTIKLKGVDGVEFDYNFGKHGFIPFMITKDLYNVFNQFISYPDKFTTWSESREKAPKTRGNRLLFVSGRNGHYTKRIIATNKDEDVKNVQYSLMLDNYTTESINYEILEKNLLLPIYRFIYDFLGANRGQSRTWILRTMPMFKDMFTKEISIDEHFQLLGITDTDGKKVINYLDQGGSLGGGKL